MLFSCLLSTELIHFQSRVYCLGNVEMTKQTSMPVCEKINL
ncbi:hypothetical protein E2C01_050828 [Portunus trituberculatus]|uniref:Uncharacterized protein n=1 Tax=Portunus trituberculatus TaxID=210409 RepID=A0A5B7GD51_PORTR|nr:hypothetical protein [Portunus trituberculatus]